MRTPIESARWRALACSEASASCYASAASYGISKDVGVLTVVEAELKLRQVQRQVFLADVLFRYLDEQAFRYNERKTSDGMRFVEAAGSAFGKRLTYKELTGKDAIPTT